MSTTNQRRAVGVGRVSKLDGREIDPTNGAAKLRSVEDQHEVTEAMAKKFGLKLVKQLVDLNRSGGTMDRDCVNEAVQMILDGVADVILFPKVDRYTRNTEEGLATLRKVSEAGGSILFGDFEIDVRDNPNGRMLLTMLMAGSENYLGVRKVDGAKSTKAATLEGIRIAPAPLGYRVDKRVVRDQDGAVIGWEGTRKLVVDPDVAPLIPELFERRVNGHSWSALREWWHERTGEWLKVGRFASMIANRTYLGELTYGGVTSEVRHEPLVSEELFLDAQSAKAPRPARSKFPTTLLTGVIRCGGCDRPMTASRGGSSGVMTYRCQKVNLVGMKCPRPAHIVASRVDPYVEARFLEWAGNTQEETVGRSAADFAKADAAIIAAERDLTEFMDLVVDVPAERKKAKMDELNAAIDDLIAARDALHAERKVASVRAKVGDHWHDKGFGFEEKRRMIAAGIKSVTVLPSSRTAAGGFLRLPVADRVRIVWRRED